MTIRRVIRGAAERVVGRFHRRLVLVPPARVSGFDLEHDLKVIVGAEGPLCLDIGANVGQTIELLQRVFREPVIHAFEPASEPFQALTRKDYGNLVSLHRAALGSQPLERELITYAHSTLNSFLSLDHAQENRFRDVEVAGREVVEIDTVDRFLQRAGLGPVDILKVDTQGFDLEVLRGAGETLSAGSVRTVLVELNFVRMYDGQCSATDIINLLADHGLFLVDCYEKVRQENSIAWCTGLFCRR